VIAELETSARRKSYKGAIVRAKVAHTVRTIQHVRSPDPIRDSMKRGKCVDRWTGQPTITGDAGHGKG
jgi:hypothetical protein